MGIRHKVKIASYLGEERLVDGSKIRTYDKAKDYYMSLNSTSGYVEFRMFGDITKRVVRGVIDIRFAKHIKELDVAYLYDADNSDEVIHGEKANYQVIAVMPQNVKAIVYFEKIQK